MLATISRATAHDRDEIYRFWYTVYVEEMGRLEDDPHTNHAAATVSDPLYDSSTVMLARDEAQRVVATLINTCAANADLGKYEALYGFQDKTAAERQQISITTKLMVDPAFRRTRLPMLLAKKGYDLALADGITEDYIDCNDHLIGFFTRMGYVPHLGRIEHPLYGVVNSMKVRLDDFDHLRAVRSPFAGPIPAPEAAPRKLATIKEAADHAA
ncbi:MAG: hypothetical protein AAGG11_08800 [Pseudomonadota bacterium]